MDSSWNKVADWYDKHLEDDDTYHAKVVLPNLLRVMNIQKGDKILDLACGQGYFSREFVKLDAKVIGIDAAPNLIEKAKAAGPKEITYKVATSDRLDFLTAGSIDKIAIVLAIQNIENMAATFDACSKVIDPNGRLFIVMNHPAFRIPKCTNWGWDLTGKKQYRRVDQYMTEGKFKIDMNPGIRNQESGIRTTTKAETTVSFHRPLQVYMKTLANSGFCVTRLEEWISHRESEVGPRKVAEDNARKEFPLFMMLECAKMPSR